MNKEKLIEEYKHNNIPDIAKKYNTYPNKIRRLLQQYNIPIRNRSEAQSKALILGNKEHPTKGKKRDVETTIKIGQTLRENWKNLSDEEREKKVNIAKDIWLEKTEEEKQKFRKRAAEAVRKTITHGSKVERYVIDCLHEWGYVVNFHVKNIIPNEDLEVDIFLPEYRIVIEVDGPAHFFPIWGEETLEKRIASDVKKSGLLMNAGFNIIRIRIMKKFISKLDMVDICDKLKVLLGKMTKKNSVKTNRLEEIDIS